MVESTKYQEFLKMHGKPLSAINEGSDEVALISDDALIAISLLSESERPLLGGEVMTMDKDELCYAYQLWGSQYHTLNWHCQKEKDETHENYLRRSYSLGASAITNAEKVASEFDAPCYIVLSIWPA